MPVLPQVSALLTNRVFLAIGLGIMSLSMSARVHAQDSLLLEDFESGAWKGGDVKHPTETPDAKVGEIAMLAAGQSPGQHWTIGKKLDAPLDASRFQHFTFWVKSESASNKQCYAVVTFHDSSTDESGAVIAPFPLDFEGWKRIAIPFKDFLGDGIHRTDWSQVTDIAFAMGYYGGEIEGGTQPLVFDQVELSQQLSDSQ